VSSVENGNRIQATITHYDLHVQDKPDYDKGAKVIARVSL
jgi:hypothetical protein